MESLAHKTRKDRILDQFFLRGCHFLTGRFKQFG